MDNHPRNLLNCVHFLQDKNMDDLRQSFLLTMELEDARIKAQEQIKNKDNQITQLKNLLNQAIKERDQAQEKCQRIILEKIFLQQQLQLHQSTPHSGISSIEEDEQPRFSSSDCDESIVSSPPEPELPLQPNRPLPEKGKLLQAVIKAGPLLQTLLLAGPLPQWRHPPPPLDANQIPPFPVVVPAPECGKANKKRSVDGSDCSGDLKQRRINGIQ